MEEEGGREGCGWVKLNPPNTHVGPVSPASLGEEEEEGGYECK